MNSDQLTTGYQKSYCPLLIVKNNIFKRNKFDEN